ncbi:MAG TPA: serine/threonine-protein kinase [Alphaproteobacteria bacterium]|nr:serine/threonine-protein kinase [Alphaproteobacteria bacterium]
MSQVERLTEEEALPPRARRAGEGGAQLPPVTLDRYEIQLSQPLPMFDTAFTSAYNVVDTKGARESLMALVAHDRFPPRGDILPSLRSVDCPALLRAYRWAPIEYGNGGARRFAILYTQPGGSRIMPSLSEPITPMSEDALIEGVIRPLVVGLAELSARGIAHRAIRPDNMYFKDAAMRQITLGDCAIMPAGSTNSALFETIENGMTHPMGRGPGSTADDLYAVGATLLVLALGINPVAGVSDHDLIAAKIEKGSYAALAAHHRLSQTLREPIRGLLADDLKERWSLQDLALWLDGRRLSPIQPSVPPRAGRGFPFAGAEYFSCRGLAHAMASNWAAVGQAVCNGDLEAWVGRSVGDGKTAAAVAEVVAWGGSEGGQVAEGLFAGRMCMMLDPKGPLRFKNIAATLDGLGPMLYSLQRDPNGAQAFAQLIASDLPLYWINNRYGDGPDSRTAVKTVDRLRYIMKRTAPGSGVERCLYELNSSLPCLSPAIESLYVVDAESLLPALETVAGSRDRPSFPIDRHIAAFIAARFRQGAEDHVEAIANRNEPTKAILGAMRAFAVMQWKLGPPHLPQLAAWLGKLAEVVIDGYYGIALRKELHEQLQRVMKKGSLVEILNFVDDKAQRERDKQGYQQALAAFAAAEAEIDRLSAEGAALDRRAERLAGRIATIVSAAVALGVVAVLFVMRHG